MSSIDQQFIEYIVKSLVGNPDAVKIERRIDEKGVLLELTVDPEDLGRVIGKRGATAQSLRTLLRALGTKNEARYNLKIVDNGEPRAARDDAGAGSRDQSGANEDSYANDDNDSWSSPSQTNTFKEDVNEDSNQTSDKLARTREELNDLDDLDI